MNASKYLVSSAAALAVVGAIGIAYAQTGSMAPASAATTESTTPNSTTPNSTTTNNTNTNSNMNSSGTTDSNMPRDTSTMSADRDLRADRN